MSKIIVKYTKTTDDVFEPTQATKGAAGIDLAARESVPVTPDQPNLVGTGISVAIPRGYLGLLIARSSLQKHGIMLANCVGVIDSDYRGEIMVAVVSLDGFYHMVEVGQRIAQLVIVPTPQVTLHHVLGLDDTERGENGFGSTGE